MDEKDMNEAADELDGQEDENEDNEDGHGDDDQTNQTLNAIMAENAELKKKLEAQEKKKAYDQRTKKDKWGKDEIDYDKIAQRVAEINSFTSTLSGLDESDRTAVMALKSQHPTLSAEQLVTLHNATKGTAEDKREKSPSSMNGKMAKQSKSDGKRVYTKEEVGKMDAPTYAKFQADWAAGKVSVAK